MEVSCLLTILCLVFTLVIGDNSYKVPHVSECKVCQECWQVDPESSSSISLSLNNEINYNRESEIIKFKNKTEIALHSISPDDIGPSPNIIPRELCPVCYGCDSTLVYIKNETARFAHLTYHHGVGATDSWVFYAFPEGLKQRFIVKVFCFPYSKADNNKPAQQCRNKVYHRRLSIVLGLDKLGRDCGVSELYTRVWVAPLHAILPDGPLKGFVISWHVLWMEEAPGISVWALNEGSERLTYLLLAEKLNKTQVVLQTAMDLLTAQCDRHSENVFIDANGNLKFIDNDRALGEVTGCGSNSFLVPGGLNHDLLRLGRRSDAFAMYYERAHAKPDFCAGYIDVRVLMDYRCAVEKQRLETNYPRNIEACLRQLADPARPVSAIMRRYGFVHIRQAAVLRQRAVDMLSKGFEWTMEFGQPSNRPKQRYPIHPPCCSSNWVPSNYSYRHIICGHCWMPELERPNASAIGAFRRFNPDDVM